MDSPAGASDIASERIDVTETRPLDPDQYEHRARYAWVIAAIPSGQLLDVACGTGHGSELLAAHGSIIGIDRDQGTIERAKDRVAGNFITAEVPPIPLDDDSVDAVVSFETIEHLEEDREFLTEVARILRPQGTLFISTPNKNVSSPDSDPNNPFHVREYTLVAFRTLLEETGFQILSTLGQRTATKSLRQRLARAAIWRLRFLARWSPRIHRFIYGSVLDLDVRPMIEEDEPAFWVLQCRLTVSPKEYMPEPVLDLPSPIN